MVDTRRERGRLGGPAQSFIERDIGSTSVVLRVRFALRGDASHLLMFYRPSPSAEINLSVVLRQRWWSAGRIRG